MAEKRQPMAVEVNGAYLFVKTPDPVASDLFTNYQRVTGLSSFTLPAEVGGVNETQQMDGTVQFASRKGVGTITGAIGSLDSHVAQRFLEDASLSGDTIQIAIVRLAVSVFKYDVGPKAVPAEAIKALRAQDAYGISDNASDFKNTVLPGHLFAIESVDKDAGDPDALPASVAPYNPAAAAAANDALWQSIVSVDENGTSIIVAPGFVSAITVGAAKVRTVFIRRPGATWKDILCSVSGFDSGDFQQGSALAGNITLTPQSAVPAKTPEYRTTLAQSAVDGSYTTV